METMSFKLEKNIKLPPRAKYSAVNKAEVGDSILVKNINEARYVQQKMKGKGWTATARAVGKGFRVWRTG
jgi:hypothetical protein